MNLIRPFAIKQSINEYIEGLIKLIFPFENDIIFKFKDRSTSSKTWLLLSKL